MKHVFTTILFAGVVASQLGATDCGNAIADPGFDLWCGTALCDWKVERGGIQRVATWNEGDPGVELVGDDVAIEQLSPVASTDGACLEFDLIANIDLDATVTLNVDISGDGTIEHSQQLPSAPWQSLAYKLPIDGVYRGIRFEITKQGSGQAVLAQIGAQVVDDCGGLIPIVPAPAPLGAPCTTDAGCASDLCATTLIGRLCAACDGTCPDGSSCGLGDPTSPVRELPRQCVLDASRALGEQCLGGAECATGICTFPLGQPSVSAPGAAYGSCSTCGPDASCANGAACGPAWGTSSTVTTPFVCAPGAHARQHGEPCVTDDDCASSACSGAMYSQCDDGRECATSLDCPFGGDGTLNGLQQGPCTTVGVTGGSCQ